MAEMVDLRGLSCPLPVVETRKMIKKASTGDTFEVLVETGTARDNVARMARKEGCGVAVEVRDTGMEEEYLLRIKRE